MPRWHYEIDGAFLVCQSDVGFFRMRTFGCPGLTFDAVQIINTVIDQRRAKRDYGNKY